MNLLVTLILIFAIAVSGLSFSERLQITDAQTTNTAVPDIEWQNVFPGDFGTSATCIIQSSDGGYAVGGDGNYKNGAPGFFVKLDRSGTVQWNQSYITVNKYSNNIQSVVQTADGGYLLLIARSELIKTDTHGKPQWNVTFDNVSINALVQVSDGYALAGDAATDQIRNGRNTDYVWLAKVNHAGTLLWNKTLGELGNNQANSLVKTRDGGFAVAGKSNAYNEAGEYDFLLIEADSSGNQEWVKTFGESGGDSEASSLIQTNDDGYVLAGSTTAYGLGGYDAWLVKTDPSGNLLWTRTYGGTGVLPDFFGNITGSQIAGSSGTGDDHANSLIQTTDGGLAFVGSSEYEPGGGTAYTVAWLVKTDSVGNTQWNVTFGAPFKGWGGNSLIETRDGAFAMAGYSQEPGFPWIGNYYVVKTKPTLPPPTTPSPSPSSTASTSPTPAPILEFPPTTINTNGDVIPATSPILRQGNLYKFEGNLNGQLIIEKDNIAVDGQGFSLEGNGTAGTLFIRQSLTGINLTATTNVTVTNLKINKFNYGIYLDKTNNTAIIRNNLTENNFCIFETATNFASIIGNNISENNYGIFITHQSGNNKINGNNIVASQSFGITLNQSDGNVVFNNSLSNSGIDFEYSSNNLIAGNLVFAGLTGVYMNGGNASTIAANNFTACSFGITSQVDTSGILFYMNNFNTTHPNEFKGNGRNYWDNGTVGNYWSDYEARYPNATEVDSSGIGNTPYAIIYGYIPNSLGPLFDPNTPNPNDIDHYPLLSPVSKDQAMLVAQRLVSEHNWSQLAVPSTSPNPPTPTPISIILIVLLAVVALIAVIVALVIVVRRKKRGINRGTPSAQIVKL